MNLNDAEKLRDTLPFVCYCLADDARGRYARMLYLSSSLLRAVEPKRRIVILVDTTSWHDLGDDRKYLELADEIIPIDVPDDYDSVILRSRWLKTRMRTLLSGDFIFLDADALPIRSLTGLRPQNHAHFAAARERWGFGWPFFAPADWDELFASAGYENPVGFPVYNSGVMYLRDSPECHRLSHAWHTCWSALCRSGRVYRDQPALTWAIKTERVAVTELPRSYNALVHMRPFEALGARILHYVYDGGACDGATLLDHLMAHLEATDQVDWAAVRRARWGAAWVHPGSSLKRAVIMRDPASFARILWRRCKRV
jgi:hypothetical protein